MQSGVTFIIAGTLANYAIVVIAVFINLLTGTAVWAHSPSSQPTLTHYILLILSIFNSLVVLSGVFRITTPNPVSTASESGGMARFGWTLSLVAGWLAVLCIYEPSPDTVRIGLISYFISLAFTNIGMFAFNAYLLDLATQSQDSKLARQCHIVLWVMFYALMITSLALVALIIQVLTSKPAPSVDWTDYRSTLIALGIGSAALFIASIWWLIMMFCFRQMLSGAYALAVYAKSRKQTQPAH